MSTLATSFMTGRERNCTYSIVLDKRSNRTRTDEYPLSVRFTIDKKSMYIPIGGCYTPQYFSDVANAKKSRSPKYTEQQNWIVVIDKYRTILTGLNRGRDLTLEQIKTSISGKSSDDSLSFIGIWEQVIDRLTKEGRFTTAESYTCALRSFRKVLWNVPVVGFKINSEILQKWSDGMRNGVKDKDGKLVGKISDATRGIYLRTARVIWNECVRLGYLSNAEYPFSNKKALGLVSIPKGATRKDRYLNVEQMTDLFYVFRDRATLNHGVKTILRKPISRLDCSWYNISVMDSIWLMPCCLHITTSISNRAVMRFSSTVRRQQGAVRTVRR